MKTTRRMSLGIAASTAAAAAAVLGAAVVPGARAAAQSAAASAPAPANSGILAQAAAVSVPAPANSGIPAQVNPGADLAARPAGPQSANDSIYVVNFFKAGGHRYGLLVHALKGTKGKLGVQESLTDITAGRYKTYQTDVPAGKWSWSTSKLSVHAPGLTWTGDIHHQTLHATAPWGTVNLHYAAHGPALDYDSNGIISVWGSENHEYALPDLSASGTLTVGGTTSAVTGNAWLDRQWGPIPFSPSNRWTWMDLNLSNGDKIAVWDQISATAENSWATILHPDGSYQVAEVQPLADGASDPWTSPVNHTTYPTRWNVEIPATHSRFQVKVTGPDNQQVPTGLVEATGAVTGSDAGTPVTGHTYIEEAG